MSHTGEVRVPRSRRPSAAKRGGGGGDADSSVPRYGAAEQLTAVVRVSQRDADAGRVSEGELRNAFVHSYGIGGGGSGGREGEDADVEGGGSAAAAAPKLLTLSIDSPRGLMRDQMKRRQKQIYQISGRESVR